LLITSGNDRNATLYFENDRNATVLAYFYAFLASS
jgi:hypothetical protein